MIMSKITSDYNAPSVTIAHREELVSQISLKYALFGIAHKVIAPSKVIKTIVSQHMEEYGRSFVNENSIAAVAGIDTLNSRANMLKDWAHQIRLWQIDEAHHVLADNKWGRGVAMFPNSVGVGVTGTPQRSDGKGLGIHADGVFHDLVIGPSPRELIDEGYLCEYALIGPKSQFNRDNLVIGANGEFTSKSQAAEEQRAQIVGDIVEKWCIHAFGKQTIVFVSSVQKAEEVAKRFCDLGIKAKAVSSKSSDDERFHSVKDFRLGKLTILVNCDLFGEGFDVPGVEVVQMARATMSLGLYLQMIGRALRPSEGKEYAIIIDQVGNVSEHGLPDRPRVWSLDRTRQAREKKDPDEIPLSTCPECSHVFERLYTSCPKCGHKPPPAERATPQQVDGDLTMLTPSMLAQMRAAAELESPASLSDRMAFHAGPIAGKRGLNIQTERIETQNELKNIIAYWAGYGRMQGKSDSELYRRFYFRTGVDVLTALSQPTKEMRKIIEELKQ